MLLKEKTSNHMVEVNDVLSLMDLNCEEVVGRCQEGEEEQDSESYNKSNLIFLSGEELPRCWRDPHYRDQELHR